MGALKTFLAGLGAFLTALAEWWQRRAQEERDAADRSRRDDVLDDPAGEWMRKFKEQSKGTPTGSGAGEQHDQR